MTSDLRAIDGPTFSTFDVAPHHCFACGTLNAHGIGMVLHAERDRAWTELELEPRFQGWDGIAHGGILCTILDEVMAWSLAATDDWSVTARMNVEFRKPVALGTPLRADGWIRERRRRIIHVEGRLVDTITGAELATSTGVYVAVDAERKAEIRARYGLRSDMPGRVAGAPSVADDTRPMTTATIDASSTTARAIAFVAERRPVAEALGVGLAEQLGDPDAFAASLRAAFVQLADPEYHDGQHRVAPGLGLVHGVRWPLLAALARGLRSATRRDPSTPILLVADRLFREPELEARWFAFGLLERTLRADPERTWQLLRRAAREAADWITVDSLAHPYATGIADEPYRWAELEQLVYSPSRWERRLVGSTIATMTHGKRHSGRGPAVVARALPLLEQLMGDAEPDVQKALSWAFRSLVPLDPVATVAALRREAERAVSGDDGHRAWVIKDSLSKLDPDVAGELRRQLGGIRKRPGAPSTSTAAAMAARFGGLPDPINHPQPPLA